MVEKYGSHYMATDEFKERRDKTWKEKYGNSYLASFVHKSLYNNKKYSQTKEFRKIMEVKRNWVPLNKIEDFKLYKLKVWKITNKQNLTILKNYNKRGRVDINKDCYHLDHIISISEGFLKNIPPFIIGNTNNLQMLYWKDNIIKSNKMVPEND